jgi:hypothetical protein
MATPSDEELFAWSEVLVLVDNDKEMALMMLQNFLESERESFNTVVLQVWRRS